VRIQVQDQIYLFFRADGEVELRCNNLEIDAQSLAMALEQSSSIFPRETLNIGLTDKDYKAVTLNEDNIREYQPTGVGQQSTRDYVIKVAWKDAASKLSPMFTAAAAVCTNPLLAQVVAALQGIATALDMSNSVTLHPGNNSIIGKAESSAEHLTGN